MEVLTEEGKIPTGSMGVWTLAWPSIITNLFYATSSIVAIKVVGNLGPDAIAAAVTGQRVTFILQAVLKGTGGQEIKKRLVFFLHELFS